MNFTGTYKEQQFYEGEKISWVEAQQLSGCNCYCDEDAMKTLEELIREFPAEGIHFLDSGNYHYVSLLWLKKIREPFCMVMFDNHTDIQTPSFGGLLSCGGWAAAALEELPFLKEMVLAGPDQEAFDQTEPLLRKKVRFLSREKLRTEKKEKLTEFFHSIPKDIPVYISVDKDVLSPKNATTSWSQGDMSLDELEKYLKAIFEGRRVLGVDVCGECDPLDDCSKNEMGNRMLKDIWKEWRDSHEK